MATTRLNAGIDKSLSPAPQGDMLATPEAMIEVEIVPDGEVAIDEPVGPVEEHGSNLADFLSSGALTALAAELETEIDQDIQSRSEWEDSYKSGLDLLGLHMEDRTEPWAGACGVYHPMIAEAAVRFQAELTTETFPASGPVRTQILGKETPLKKEAASRVEEEMNYQLTTVMQEYRPEHERMLWNLPMTGSAFKKIYKDTTLNRQVSMFVPAEDIILPYGTSDLGMCNRLTHRFRKTKIDIERLQEAGFYRDTDVQESIEGPDQVQEKKDKESGLSSIQDTRPVLYEVHADLCLANYDEKSTLKHVGEMRPYVVTKIKGTSTVLAIRRNWAENDALALKKQHFVHYQYVPGFGAYGFGLFHLIGGYARASTSILRQLVDAGTLSNVPGGYKTKGMRITGDGSPIKPGEFRDVHVGSGTISENLMTLPYKEPSAVLAQLLDRIIEDGRRMSASADLQISDMSSQAPVGTTLALLERTLKVMTAVQARCHFVLKQEFALLAEIIRDGDPKPYAYDPDSGDRRAKKEDFSMVDILPVSDPNAATMSQRLMQYQAALQMAQGAPQIYNMPLLHREMLDVLGIKNGAKLVPMPEDMKPKDPVTENANILMGIPVKAFLTQDHDAHIAVHQMLMQDPQVQAAIGQNPQAQNIMAADMAHIAEHAAYRYRLTVSQQLGMPLPDMEADIDPQVERELAPLLAQAAQQSLMQNQKAAAQQQAQQQMQDPGFMLEQKRLAQKDKEIAVKELAVKGKIAVDADRLDLDRAVAGEQGIAKRADIALRQEGQDATISARGIELGQKTAPAGGV